MNKAELSVSQILRSGVCMEVERIDRVYSNV